MPRIRWSQPANLDILRLHAFLVPKGRDAAYRAIHAIQQSVKKLGKHPEIGRLIEGLPSDIRELVIEFGQSAYVARYQHMGAWVVILAVRHGRESSFGEKP